MINISCGGSHLEFLKKIKKKRKKNMSLQLTYTTLLNSGTRSRFYSPKEFLKMAVI
jgi:hypothetical protein